MTRGSPVIVVATVLAVCGGTVRTAAQELPGSYIAIKVGLGLGGSVGVHNDYHLLTEPEEVDKIEIPKMDSRADLNTSFGGQAEYMFGLHRYFALGGLFGVRSWRSAAAVSSNEGTSFGLDAGVVPQGRLPVGNRLEFYVALPLSLTLSILSEYIAWTELKHPSVGTALTVEPTFGFGLGVLAGARFLITGSFGLLAEVGYQRFAFTHSVQFKVLESRDDMGLGTALSTDFVTEQAIIRLGAFF